MANTVNVIGSAGGGRGPNVKVDSVRAAVRKLASDVGKAAAGEHPVMEIELALGSPNKMVQQIADFAGIANRNLDKVFKQFAKESKSIDEYMAKTQAFVTRQRTQGKEHFKFVTSEGKTISTQGGVGQAAATKTHGVWMKSMTQFQEQYAQQMMAGWSKDVSKLMKGQSPAVVAKHAMASAANSIGMQKDPKTGKVDPATKKLLAQHQQGVLTYFFNKQYKSYEKEFGAQGAFSRASADVAGMSIPGVANNQLKRIRAGAISSSIGPASVQARVDAEAKKSHAAGELKAKQESAEEQKTSNWVFKQRQADNKRKSQSAARVPSIFSKASIRNRFNDEILASSLESHEVADTFHADEMAKIATAEAAGTLTPKQARIARSRLARETFKHPSENVEFRAGEQAVSDLQVAKIHDDELLDLRPGVQSDIKSLNRVAEKRRDKAAKIRAAGGEDAENRAKNLESQALGSEESASRLQQHYDTYTSAFEEYNKSGRRSGSAKQKYLEAHQNLVAAKAGGTGGKRGDKGFNQKWNYAMPQLAYGLEDFFQVIAMGQSPLRGFLAAANNLGPALSALGLAGGMSSVAVAGMLGVAAIFNHKAQSAKKYTDEWSDSLKRLGDVSLAAEAAQTKLTSGLFATASGKFSDAPGAILGKIVESPEKTNVTLQNINRLRLSNERSPILAAQEQGLMKTPQKISSRMTHNAEILFNHAWSSVKDAWDIVFASDVVRKDVSDEDFMKPMTIQQLRHAAPGAIGLFDFAATSQTSVALQEQYKKDNAEGGSIQIRRKKLAELNAQGAELDETARQEKRMTPQKIAEGFTRAFQDEALSGQRGGAASYLKSVQGSYEDARKNASVAKDNLTEMKDNSDVSRMNSDRLVKLREMYRYATTGTTGNVFRDGDIASGSDYEEYQRNIGGAGGGRAVAVLRLHNEIAKREADKKLSDNAMQNAEQAKKNADQILKNRDRGLQEIIGGAGGMAEMAAVFGIDLGTASSIDMNNRSKSLKSDKLKVLIKDKSQRDFLIDALGNQTTQKNNSSFMNDPRVRAVISSRGGFIDPFDYGGVSGRSLNVRDAASSILEDRQDAILAAKAMPAKTDKEKKLRDDAIEAVEASTNRKLAQEIYSKYNLHEPRNVRMMDSEGLYKAIQESLTVDPAYELEANQLEQLKSIFKILSETKNMEEARLKMNGLEREVFDKMAGGNKDILGGALAMGADGKVGLMSSKDLRDERKTISDELNAGVPAELEQEKRDRINEINAEINARRARGEVVMNGGLGVGAGSFTSDIATNTGEQVASDLKPYLKEIAGYLSTALGYQADIVDNTSGPMEAVTT